MSTNMPIKRLPSALALALERRKRKLLLDLAVVVNVLLKNMNGIKGCYAAENFLTLIIILQG